MRKRMYILLLCLVLAGLLLVACGPTPTAILTPTATLSPLPTVSPLHSPLQP